MILMYDKKDGGKVSLRLREVDIGKVVTLGRGREAVVRIEDEKCSRIHAAIRYWDGIFVLRDMHSNNGTYKNGQRIEVTRIMPGDVILVGETEIRVNKDDISGEDTIIVA